MHFADLFIPGEPILAKILRPVIVYGFLVVSLRLAGKRELAQLNPFDLIVLLTLSNTVQHAIIGNDNSVTGGLIGAVSLLVLNYGVVRFLHRHERLDRLFGGDPVVLIEDGWVRDDRCASETVTRGELEAAAHKQGFPSLDEVRCSNLAACSRCSAGSPMSTRCGWMSSSRVWTRFSGSSLI
jgi:uncharacterized membrane protein YcaP (DUF421 family)